MTFRDLADNWRQSASECEAWEDVPEDDEHREVKIASARARKVTLLQCADELDAETQRYTADVEEAYRHSMCQDDV